jgi:hypothetical protein
LIVGLHEEAAALDEADEAGLFAQPFASHVPPFSAIEAELCSLVPCSDSVGAGVEAYQPASGTWQSIRIEDLRGSQLFRARGAYGGTTYYLQHTELGIRIKINEPEWAFVAALHLLPWRREDLYRIEGRSVRTWRATRLPTLLYRWLFASSARVRIGSTIIFEDVDMDCIEGVHAYFEAVGERS